MKKFLFIASALAIVAGCAKVTTVNTEEPQEIAFKAYTNVSTKAPLAGGETFPTNWPMQVHALYDGNATNPHYFGDDGDTFKYNNIDAWVGSTTHYWPATGTLTFNAIAPVGTVDGATATVFENVEFKYTENYDIDNITATLGGNVGNQTDVLVARTKKSSKIVNGGALEMLFDHALAQINVTASLNETAAATEDYSITIKKIQIKGTHQQGKLTAEPSENNVKFSWSETGDPVPMTIYEDNTGVTLSGTASVFDGAPESVADSKAVLAVPETLTDDHVIELTYDINYPNGVSMTGVKSDLKVSTGGVSAWDAGKKYIYNLNFTGPQEIKIAPSVESWIPENVEVPGI